MVLFVILVEAASGIVLALRVVTLPPTFTYAVDSAIRAQAAAGWPGQAAYNRALANIHSEFPHGIDLLPHTLARCIGGSSRGR